MVGVESGWTRRGERHIVLPERWDISRYVLLSKAGGGRNFVILEYLEFHVHFEIGTVYRKLSGVEMVGLNW